MTSIRMFCLIALAIDCHAVAWCPVRLPGQDDFSCRNQRMKNLNISRTKYGIKKATTEMPYNRLNMSPAQYYKFLATAPFLAGHARLYITQARFAAQTSLAYSSGTFHSNRPEMTMFDFAAIRAFYRNVISSPANPIRAYMKYPSEHEPFQSNFNKWISDHFFAEQRLAGINPLTIQKITLSRKIGMNLRNLKQLLNPKFNLVKAVNKVLSFVKDNASLRKAIKNDYLFVLYHPLGKGIQSSPDLTDNNPNRTMWKFKSPIALFASRKAALTPIAIQMDDDRDAPVYTPQDGDNWMLAKLNTNLADISISQIVEHLNKVHFTIEAVCLSVERQLSAHHPLYDILRFHCRGVLTTNTLGAPTLLNDNEALDRVYEFGNEGVKKISKKAAAIIDWRDLDLRNNLKRRGVYRRRSLPYYPYRDDGFVIYNVLKGMSIAYVKAFYRSSRNVRGDYELQNFAREISKGGNGEIRGFPARIRSRASLVNTLARILWLVTGQHTAVNYPLSDYATYIPNAPGKLYDIKGVPSNKFAVKRFENRRTSVDQMYFYTSLASFRMDRLFDYGSQLKTRKGKKILQRFKRILDKRVEPMLARRNRNRQRKGHLTYPYFQPSWMTNGVQA